MPKTLLSIALIACILTTSCFPEKANTYAYDSANRLRTISNQSSVSSYQYNGLGDRLSQNGVHYTLDLNTGLTQVLADGTNTYLYGLGRIAERQGTANEYYLGDALNSVRQIANDSGAITLARNYDPFGKTAQTIGTAQTDYGFTGEFTDASGLIYLRARYYQSLTGRFTSRDSYEGDINTPASLNRFNYAHSNPVMNTDPTGRCIFTGMDTILCAALTGFVAGVAAGGAFGLATYADALSGKCGCEMQQQAMAAGSLATYAGTLALSGGVLGGIAGAIAIAAPIGLIAVSGLGVVASAADLYKTYNVIANETGFTKCTVLRALMDISGIILGGVGLKAGVQAWRASGSGISWAQSNPEEPMPVPKRNQCSFTADTEVTTNKGKTPISEIQIGDYVLAWNSETGEIDWYPVTAKLEHDDPILVHLTLDGEQITTTPEHPFYTQEKGWLPAGELAKGMHVRKADGKYGVVDATRTEKTTKRMYNLTVAIAHTFFVGDGQWLVHNECKWGNPKSTPTYGHTFKEHGENVELYQLIDRARGLGHQNGQYLDDYQAAQILGDLAQARNPGVYDLPIPKGMETRVVLPDGIEVPADYLRLVIKNDGSVRTSFPFNSDYPN